MEVSRGEFFSPLPIEKYRRQAVISSSIDTLAVQLDKAKRCGGHAKTTCRVKHVKKITSKVQSGKCPSQGGLCLLPMGAPCARPVE